MTARERIRARQELNAPKPVKKGLFEDTLAEAQNDLIQRVKRNNSGTKSHQALPSRYNQYTMRPNINHRFFMPLKRQKSPNGTTHEILRLKH